MSKNRRPLHDHEKADVMLVMLLDHAKAYIKRKLPALEPETGSLLRLLMLMMHTQEVMFQQRPELRMPYLDVLEGFMIEVEMTEKNQTEMRELADMVSRLRWAQIDQMVTDDRLDD